MSEEKKPPGHYPFHKKSPIKKKDKEESEQPPFGPKRPPTYGVCSQEVKFR